MQISEIRAVQECATRLGPPNPSKYVLNNKNRPRYRRERALQSFFEIVGPGDPTIRRALSDPGRTQNICPGYSASLYHLVLF